MATRSLWRTVRTALAVTSLRTRSALLRKPHGLCFSASGSPCRWTTTQSFVTTLRLTRPISAVRRATCTHTSGVGESRAVVVAAARMRFLGCWSARVPTGRELHGLLRHLQGDVERAPLPIWYASAWKREARSSRLHISRVGASRVISTQGR